MHRFMYFLSMSAAVWAPVSLVIIAFIVNRNGMLATLVYSLSQGSLTPCKICKRYSCPVCVALGEAEEMGARPLDQGPGEPDVEEMNPHV